MKETTFTPLHINATSTDLSGNNGIGRYIFMPGSDGRAKQIAQHFINVEVKNHPRGHHLYLGDLSVGDGTIIQVAAISTGMGCPSMEIILHELFHLGAKRFLRVGTAGTLQPTTVKIGDLVNVTASVRDELTTRDYMPIEVPAVASQQMVHAIEQAAETLTLDVVLHSGIVHCKSSFYAREFGSGPQSLKNESYIGLLSKCGVLASEMETAALLTQAHLYDYELRQISNHPVYRVYAGALLSIIGGPGMGIAAPDKAAMIIENMIKMGIEAIKVIARYDSKYIS